MVFRILETANIIKETVGDSLKTAEARQKLSKMNLMTSHVAQMTSYAGQMTS